jgi:hypothetical protein
MTGSLVSFSDFCCTGHSLLGGCMSHYSLDFSFLLNIMIHSSGACWKKIPARKIMCNNTLR